MGSATTQAQIRGFELAHPNQHRHHWLSMLCHYRASCQGQLSHTHALRARSPATPHPRPALLCCPGEVQGLLS